MRTRFNTVVPVVAVLALLLTACGGEPVVQGASPVSEDQVNSQDSSNSTAELVEAVADYLDSQAKREAEAAAASAGAPPLVPATTDTTAAVTPAQNGTEPAAKRSPRGRKPSARAQADPGSAEKVAGGGTGSAVSALERAVATTVATQQIFGGTAPCRPATLSEVRIGNVSTLSGVLGELFKPASSALDTFVASQNACGGLNGHRIKLFTEDDQGDPSTAVSKVQDLILQDKVLAFVGNIQVLTVDAIVPVIKRFGIPVLGSDMTSDTWTSNPLLFPQASNVQAGGFGYVVGARDYFKVKKVGIVYCIEVPRACEAGRLALEELAPQFGIDVVKQLQVSITAPSYVQQCLDFQSAGVEALAMSIDAASMNRLARSCTQVGFFPKVLPYPLGVGNEQQFFGNSWLGNAHIGMNSFPWMGNTTPAEKYWQASIKKFNPGFDSGGAASLAWASGALLVAASAGLSAENPTTQQILDGLYTFKGQKFTELGGLAGPRTFVEGGLPKVPYCLWSAVSNPQNTGWGKVVSKPTCTDIIAPSDPQNTE
ncbi:MAG: ABC transporter substrate-binding protein [Sporichthyaceae bacterium]